MNTYVVGLRTHKFDRLTRASLTELVDSLGSDRVILVFDDTGRTPPRNLPRGVQLILFSQAAELGLDVDFEGAGWLCGDYAHYLMQHCRPDVDTSWVVEPDIGFGRLDPAALFDAASLVEVDFIAHNIGSADTDWYWTERLDHYGFSSKSKCLYGLNRLSRRAAEACLARRLAIQEFPGAKEYPINDEALTASTVMEKELSTALLADVVPLGPFRCSGSRIPEFVAQRFLADKVSHPVVTTAAALRWWRDGALRVARRRLTVR